MITKAWTPLRYHEQQCKMWRSKARFVVAACGRGSGKTELAKRRVVRYLPIKKDWPNPLYFYGLPTYSQAKRVAWESIIGLIPKEWLAEPPNQAELKIKTKFGSTLYLVGTDKPHRIEGVQWDGGVIDECSDTKPKVFDRTIMPALAHRKGWCWRIGVPKRYGLGAKEFRAAHQNPGPDSESYSWPSEDILTSAEILLAQEMLGVRDFREQYHATWEDVSGIVFYAFDEVHNTFDVCYNKELPIVVGSDFNVDPMSWVIGHIIDNVLVIFDEISIRHTNTRKTLDELYSKYGDHQTGFEFYGDASGASRKTSAEVSDYLQIKNDTRFSSARVFFPSSNPRVASRFAATNALFCSALGERRCFIHPRCKKLLMDIETRTYKEGTSTPDDYGDVGHMTDALGYIIHKRFPIRLERTEKSQVYVGN